MLTKKDYIAITMILNKADRIGHRKEPHLIYIACKLADYFATDNPNFDKDKFIKAILKLVILKIKK